MCSPSRSKIRTDPDSGNVLTVAIISDTVVHGRVISSTHVGAEEALDDNDSESNEEGER